MRTIRIELPEPLHERAVELAPKKSMSLERLMLMALIEKLSTMFPNPALEERAKRATVQGFEDFMNAVPDVQPDPEDRLPEGLPPK